MGDQYEQELKKYRDVIKVVKSKKILYPSDLKDARKIMKKSGLEDSPELFQKLLETDLVPDGQSVRHVIFEAGGGNTKDDEGKWAPPNAAIEKHDKYTNRMNTLIETRDWIVGIIIFILILWFVIIPVFYNY